MQCDYNHPYTTQLHRFSSELQQAVVQHQKQQDIHTLYNSNTLGLYCICLESQLVFWWSSSASLPNAVVRANES